MGRKCGNGSHIRLVFYGNDFLISSRFTAERRLRAPARLQDDDDDEMVKLAVCMRDDT